MRGAICGGVISFSMSKKLMKKDIWAGMMAFIMPDKYYKKFIAYKKQNKD